MKNVLVPVDFSDLTGAVIGQAVTLFRLTGAALTMIHVAPPEPEFVGYESGPVSVRDAVAHRLREEHRQLQALDRQLASQGVLVTSLLIQGYPVEKILAEAARIPADVIVMGSHGRSLLRHLVVGSVTDGVLRKAMCPVLIVPVSAQR